MIESVRQGVVGLMMLVGAWLAPSSQQPAVKIERIAPDPRETVVSCHLKIAWNQQLEKLVNAGVPLTFRFDCTTPAGDAVVFFRTLTFNVLDYTYSFTDSSRAGVTRYKNYELVYLALNDFCDWTLRISPQADRGRIEVTLLPAWVSRLNRQVDLSLVWGQKNVVHEFEITFPEHKKIKRE